VEAEDGAELVAGGTVLVLLGDGGEIGDVIFGGHGDAAEPETLEAWVVVDEGIVLGVGVEEVEGCGGLGSTVFDMAEEAAQDGGLEWMEEESECWRVGEGVEDGVGVVKFDGREGVGGRIALPELDVGLSNASEPAVELDAFDAEEWILRGEQESAALAGADVEEYRALDGSERRGLPQPLVEERTQDAGRNAVIGGKMFDFGASAASDGGAGDEARGVGAVALVERMDGGLRLGAGHVGAG